ncbi:MAG TPA: DUF1634 domain-containing protein [Hyalangium sp.]|nr:DUF1634 domain-containing protein [Hyalangium sp.]
MSVQPTVEAKATAPAAAGGPELLISSLLRYGVMVSLGFVLFGMVLTFIHHPDYFSSAEALQRLTEEGSRPHQLSDVMAGVMATRGRAIAMVGLLVMMAIPVARVALSLLIFRQQRDRAFVMVTSVVLTLLVLSFLLGHAE